MANSTAIDYTGRKFHMLTAISFTGEYNHRRERMWNFRCDCGAVKSIRMANVSGGYIKSCGCQAPKKSFGVEATLRSCFASGKYNDGNLTFEDFKELCKQECHWCGKWRPNVRKGRNGHTVEYHGLDRIDNAKGHNRDNVVPCCWKCNDKRSDATYQEHLEWIQDIYLNRIASNNGTVEYSSSPQPGSDHS
jgi:hypothetical protein